MLQNCQDKNSTKKWRIWLVEKKLSRFLWKFLKLHTPEIFWRRNNKCATYARISLSVIFFTKCSHDLANIKRKFGICVKFYLGMDVVLSWMIENHDKRLFRIQCVYSKASRKPMITWYATKTISKYRGGMALECYENDICDCHLRLHSSIHWRLWYFCVDVEIESHPTLRMTHIWVLHIRQLWSASRRRILFYWKGCKWNLLVRVNATLRYLNSAKIQTTFLAFQPFKFKIAHWPGVIEETLEGSRPMQY